MTAAMASVKNIKLSSDANKNDIHRLPPTVGMPGESDNNCLNKPIPPPRGDLRDLQQQREREERVRLFHERQEEERVKRLKELEQSFVQAKKYREQQEEERKRKIEEARVREIERRQQVEERKRQIWEAEQERKEAILRRNMEREARIEARRNAQRNSQCFAFGSSTPRTFDLDLAALGVGRGSVLMSSVSGRRSEEREPGPPTRATSACSLDRKFESDIFFHENCSNNQQEFNRAVSLEPICHGINLSKQIAMHHKSSEDMKACLSMWDDNYCNSRHSLFEVPSSGWLVGSGVKIGEDCMSRSMVSLSSSSSAFRGRRRTDIMPTPPMRERSATPHLPRGNASRAVSMTRLDQLAQPRRTLFVPRQPTSPTMGGPRTATPSMSVSMCNLNIRANAATNNRKVYAPPVLPPKPVMRAAQSMMHLAVAPRLTRTARLRAEALAGSRAASAWNLNRAETLSPGKDSSRSPPRPQSSLSGASELSAASSTMSAVNMRPRTAPRRPRPYSVAGCIVDRGTTPSMVAPVVKKEPERQPRLIDKNVSKPARAKSMGREDSAAEANKHLTAPRKPVPPPKSSEVLAKAKTHSVPVKDNLRKVPKVMMTAKSNVSASNAIDNEKSDGNVSVMADDKASEVKASETGESQLGSAPDKTPEPAVRVKKPSPLVSPATDSEMCISSDDSKYSAVTSTTTTTESISHSAPKAYEPAPEVPSGNEVAAAVPDVPANREPEVPPVEASPQKGNDENAASKEVPSSKTRITSEEEAKAALAEKRRLAREQAEREAELERQRQEEIRRQEEEKKRLEELEQKRMEEEQARLAEIHRQMEEEKLQKAIEEREQRDREEQQRREEEARQKAEKEEQERKAREEAEKQRLELEERLRKEEKERAERKKRVEEIMARTRGKNSAASTPNAKASSQVNIMSKSMIVNGSHESKMGQMDLMSSSVIESSPTAWDISNEARLSQSGTLPDLLIANTRIVKNGVHEANGETNSIGVSSRQTPSANDGISPSHTNGYSSHEEMSCTTSPEEVSDTGLLIDVQSSEQRSLKISSECADYTKLVDLGEPISPVNLTSDSYLINVDAVNSNLINAGNPLIEYEETVQKKQETTVTDLLS